MDPLLAYAGESLGSMPVRVAGSLAMAFVMLGVVARGTLSPDPAVLALFALSVVLAWLLSFFVSATIGALAFFFSSSSKIMDAWLAGLFVFSGYLIPVDLFPARLGAVVGWLPFRYQLGLPVELLVGAHDRSAAFWLVLRQLGFVVAGALVMRLVWRKGLSRFAAYGG